MKRVTIVLLAAATALLTLLIGPAQAEVPAVPVTVHSGTNSAFCLDVAAFSFDDNAAILHFECNGAPNQVFTYQFKGQSIVRGTTYEVYTIVSNWSGKCLDVLGESTSSGGRVIQKTCNNRLSQQWLTFAAGLNGFSNLINGNTTGGLFDNPRCLDIPGATTGRAQMQIWSCNGTPAQRFTPIPA